MSNADILAELEAAWGEIQKRHPKIPDVCLVLSTGAKNGKYVKHGHWWPNQWSVGGKNRPEVLLASEHLRDGARAVLTTLLHEAVHGLAYVRKVQDTSRQNRWHNKHFAKIAVEMGLEVEQNARFGHVTPDMTHATATEYIETLTRLMHVIGATPEVYRRRPTTRLATASVPRRRFVSYKCSCDNEIRVPRGARLRIMCWDCGDDFTSQ